MRLLAIVLVCVFNVAAAQHPIAFATAADLKYIKDNYSKFPVMKVSYEEMKRSVDGWLGKDVDVPVPKDPQGGYTHDRHKENYMLVFNAGLLYNITGNVEYAKLAKNIMLKYAGLNPTLKNHPEATSSSPGHIFWQALNDANWMVYTGLGYDLIYNSLTPAERKKIEDGAFKPEVDFVTKDLESWFNLIHNHGVWACAGVGIIGIATNNEDYVKKALYGTKGDGKSGFIAQMDGLFSPDGYYTEGPYYVRYALLPFYMFANALNHAKPSLNIFQHRDQILRKALLGGFQQTNIDGSFFPFNDAMKEKDYTTNEMVTAIGIARNVYGKEPGFLTVAQKQGRVLINKGGAMIASELGEQKSIPSYYPYTSIEFTDGAKGDEGGISILRSGKAPEQSTLVFKYASHGLSHGHYDQLGYSFYNNGAEVLQDYGSVRFIGVEQKYGGRYLPENKTYASQTIAHNTLVVDEKCQFDGKEDIAEKYHSDKLFSDVSSSNVQVVSAKEENAYSGVKMIRTVYMVAVPGYKKPLVLDLFRVLSNESHQYDLPFQYQGTVINTSFKYQASASNQQAMGKKNGYQFLWKEAEARLSDSLAQFTFLYGGSYYTISSLVNDSATAFFTRIGANDPNFNLRRDPAYIIRKKGKEQVFVNAIEIHGKFDPVAEFSTNSYPSLKKMSLLQNNDEFTVVGVAMGDQKMVVAQCNKDFNKQSKHSLTYNGTTIQWTGPYVVLMNGKQFN